MPAFQKIGGVLANEVAGDGVTLHAAVIAINEAIDRQEEALLLEAVGNTAARLKHVHEMWAAHYQKMLYKAKKIKVQASLNKSMNDSYVADVYDELLTQAEIQGHILAVNVHCIWSSIMKAMRKSNSKSLVKSLSNSSLDLKGVCKGNEKAYMDEAECLARVDEDATISDMRAALQDLVVRGNSKAQWEHEQCSAVESINAALDDGSWNDFFLALKNPSLNLSNINEFAAPLFFEEMRIDKNESGQSVTLNEIESSVRVLSHIAAVSQAVDMASPDRTWEALSNPEAHFMDLDPALKVKYWRSLTAARRQKIAEKCECQLLTYGDVQLCIDVMNQDCDDSSQMVESLHDLNSAVKTGDSSAVIKALLNPGLKLVNLVTFPEAPLYLKLLQRARMRRLEEDAELWLEDVEAVMYEVREEVCEAQSACGMLTGVNRSLQQNNPSETFISLQSANLELSPASQQHDGKLYAGLRDCKRRRETLYSCPWVVHQTSRDNTVYLNMETHRYSWNKPDQFQSESNFLATTDIEGILISVRAEKKSLSIEKAVVKLQARCRGFLLRKQLGDRLEEFHRNVDKVITIQAWWRGSVQRRKYLEQLRTTRRSMDDAHADCLSKYKVHEAQIVKIQALFRGWRARKAFISLVHQPKPSFKFVRYFIPLLDFSSEDYHKDLQLQNHKAQVVQTIRRNQQLSQQLDEMDIKIGLLVHNRITLQDVVAHGTTLNDLTRESRGVLKGPTEGGKGLKSLTKEGRRLLDGYSHLFYTLQTNPRYLSKLMFCLPQSRTTKLLQSLILTLYNYGSTSREEYLLLKLLSSALQEEIRCKFQKPSEVLAGNPLVLKMVVNYCRQKSGQNSIRSIVGPLIEKVLNDKNIVIDTNPVDIYKYWRNQTEMTTGKSMDLPYSVTQEHALSYKEVRQRLEESISTLQDTTLAFLKRITECRNLIPYGMLYMAKVLKSTLHARFPRSLEKDILKVVGNLIYYQFINCAIVAPDAFDIISLLPNQSLQNDQRRNLASISKILQFAAAKKGFGEESRHLISLNPFIVESHETFKDFFRRCCEVEELEEHFSVDEFTEATLISRPVIYITPQELCNTHELLMRYVDQVAPDPADPLHELLDELGLAPSLPTLLGLSSEDSAIPLMAKTELCLTLVNKFEVPEDDITTINKLFIKTKEQLVTVLPCIQGNSLLEALVAPGTPAQERAYTEQLVRRLEQQEHQNKLYRMSSADKCCTLGECKMQLRRNLIKLELQGLVSQDDGYQNLLTSLAKDVCNKGIYRKAQAQELETLKATKLSLDCKTRFYEEQVDFYNQYIRKCLENLNAGKRRVHALKVLGKQPGKVRCKLTLKYTAAKLHEKGVLLEVEGLPSAQLKNVQFEISPTEHNGVFMIRGKFMGVEMEKVDIDIQNLLQLQFEGVTIMNMFGKAKINVNLLLFLLNSKFYSKS